MTKTVRTAKPAPRVVVRRIYDDLDPVADTDEYRVLVDRLWPRGVSKAAAGLDEWCRELAPSTELRTWYGHVPERRDEFAARYLAELDGAEQQSAAEGLLARAGKRAIVLLTATKDLELSHAVVLAERLGPGRAR